MCKTHCLDTDTSESEKPKGVVNLTTPPIRISYKAPHGQSIMEIEPKQYIKSHKRKHSSKHKSKKHTKKSKRSSSIVADQGIHADNHNGADNDAHLHNGSATTAQSDDLYTKSHSQSAATAEQHATAVPGRPTVKSSFDSLIDGDEDSDDHGLVIDIPGESAAKPKRASRLIISHNSTHDDGLLGMESPVSVTSVESQVKGTTKTKARLRKQKIVRKAVASKPLQKDSQEGATAGQSSSSIVSELHSRSVSTYDSPTGKHVSVGDVIWGKIVGFPWWPGRVCSITVNETQGGSVLDYMADIDWYCSPTRSNLPCSVIYPFLEEFSKR